MKRDDLASILSAKPFQPFTLHVDDGDLIGVRSPEYVWLPPVGQLVYVAVEQGDGGHMKMVSLSHISHATVGPFEELKFPTPKQ